MGEVKNWFVYIVECKGGVLYTGYTNNIEQRIEFHNSGKGAKFTRSRLPVKLVWHERQKTQSDALKREFQIKTWSRIKKVALIQGNLKLLKES